MAVGLGREAGIGVAKDSLDRRHIGAAHEEERRGRVAQVMEPDRTHLSRRPELHLAARTPAEITVARGLPMAAALASALVDPALDDSRFVERAPQNQFQLHAVRHHRAIGRGEDQR